MSYPGFNLFNLVAQVNTNTTDANVVSGNARYGVSGDGFFSKPLIFSGSGGMDVAITDVGSGLLVNYVNNKLKEKFHTAGVSSNNHYIVVIANTGASAFYPLYIPKDFIALESLEILGLPQGAAAANNTILTFSTSYSKAGQSLTQFQETVATTFNLSGSGNNMVSFPVTGVLLNASAGMQLGIEIASTQASGTIRYVGALLKYR